MSQQKVPTMFKCASCSKEYNNASSFRGHMRTHSDKLHECKQCDMKFNRSGRLRYHKRTAHAEAGHFECETCGKVWPHKTALDRHKRVVHSDRKFECLVCGKKLHPGSATRHMNTHKDHPCECDVCEKVFPNTAALPTHKESAHSKAMYPCQYCGMIFGCAIILRKHMVIHDEKREYQCGRCSRTFKSRRGCEKHMGLEHSGSLFTCDSGCGLHSATGSEYREHLRSRHAKQHPTTCRCVSVDSVRAKEVATKLGCTEFMEVDGIMKCIDAGCGFTTTCARQMESHKEQCHHDAYQPVLRCGNCETWFSVPKNLKAHNADKHQGERRYKCEHCGKIFGTPSSFRSHMAVHVETPEKYQCDRCPQTFKKRRSHDKHVRTVHSDTRFTCDSECGLHSATRSAYRDHLRSQHAKQHPATCKCASLDSSRAQTIATNLRSAYVEAEGRMKCMDGGCDFATTCARQMESHKERCHHDVYQPVLRCGSCETWFASPESLRSHNADKHQGERRYKCDDCGYITSFKSHFTKHSTNCEQGRARGNHRSKQTKPTTESLDIKKESPHAAYQFGSEIGEGGFGKVYKAVKKGEDPHAMYAIKEVGPKGGHSAEIEAKRMRQFDHKNLMALLEYYEWEDKAGLTRFIVMECYLPGSLTSMQKSVLFEEPHVLYVLKEVTCGLEHIHSAGIIHRDVKSANVLVNERAEVKIADLGVSTGERIAFNFQGTRGWVAPEVAAAFLTGFTGVKSPYTQLADVYSVGVLAIDCFLPRETLPTDFRHKKKVESESFAVTQLQRVEDERHLQLSCGFKQLVTRCLAPMTARLTAAAVQKVPDVKKASFEPFSLLVADCLM